LPTLKSSKKRMRTSQKRQVRNQAVRSRVKTYLKKTRQTITEGDKDKAAAALKETYSELDNAARKGVIHPNTAARKKSRLSRSMHRKFASKK
jgi:small subunit ribosomal protein S20